LNPLELIDKYGTDALRHALSTGTSAGNDIRLSMDKIEAARNFANKLWNASRFILGNIEGKVSDEPLRDKLALEDRWILSRMNRMIASVDQLMEDFHFGEAQRQVHDFIWGEFCDWYIEIAKLRLKDENPPLPVLAHVLETSLRLLHPFMPFITEEIWHNLKGHIDRDIGESIMVAPYPVADEAVVDDMAERDMEVVIEVVRAIRNTRAEFKVEPSKWIEALVATADARTAIEAQAQAIETLARVRPLSIIGSDDGRPDNSKTIVLKGAEVILPMAGMIDVDTERARLEKQIADSDADIARLETRLSDEKFLSKAPPPVVEKERERLATQQDKASRLRERLAELG
jgi:valyl-tRNA synthetase